MAYGIGRAEWTGGGGGGGRACDQAREDVAAPPTKPGAHGTDFLGWKVLVGWGRVARRPSEPSAALCALSRRRPLVGRRLLAGPSCRVCKASPAPAPAS